MKNLVVLASLFLSLTATAADKKIGNVVAVEREVANLTENCLKNVSGDTTSPKSFFACGIKFIANNEISLSKGRAFLSSDSQCVVRGDFINGALLISFGGTSQATSFETSRNCLKSALQDKDSVKALVYTVE